MVAVPPVRLPFSLNQGGATCGRKEVYAQSGADASARHPEVSRARIAHNGWFYPASLTGADRSRPFLYNTCLTFLAPDDAVGGAISFNISNGRIGIADIPISPVGEPNAALQAVRQADGWYDAFTRNIFG